MSKPELSRVDVATDASNLGPFTLLPPALCRLNSPADIATITLDQDDVRPGSLVAACAYFPNRPCLFFGLVQSWIMWRLRAAAILNSLGGTPVLQNRVAARGGTVCE
jgi:hypothetical protein